MKLTICLFFLATGNLFAVDCGEAYERAGNTSHTESAKHSIDVPIPQIYNKLPITLTTVPVVSRDGTQGELRLRDDVSSRPGYSMATTNVSYRSAAGVSTLGDSDVFTRSVKRHDSDVTVTLSQSFLRAAEDRHNGKGFGQTDSGQIVMSPRSGPRNKSLWVTSNEVPPLGEDNPGTPAFLWLSLRQLKMCGLKYGEATHFKVESLVNAPMIIELAAKTKAWRLLHPGMPLTDEVRGQLVEETESWKYIQTVITQSGHRVTKVSISESSGTTATAANFPFLQNEDSEAALKANGLDPSDKIFGGFSINIDVQPFTDNAYGSHF